MIEKVVTQNQIKIIESLARQIWTEHYTPIIGKDQVKYMLDKYQSENAISSQINNDGFFYFLIYEDKTPVGYIGIQFKEKDLFLSKLYVEASRRSRGFGKKAVIFLEELAKEKNINRIYLTVNKYNSNTIKAYEKFGFQNAGSIVQDIGNGFIMDDYQMVKIL